MFFLPFPKEFGLKGRESASWSLKACDISIWDPTLDWLAGCCFGVGSMDSREEVPAPVLRFFAGLSSSEFSAGRDGREMVIFLGARFVFVAEGGGDSFGVSESLP